RAPRKAVSANGRLSFGLLRPNEIWHACLLYALEDGEQSFRAPEECVENSHKSHQHATMSEWFKTVVKIRTSNEEFYRLFHQALEDMAALRLPIKGTHHMVFMPAAGTAVVSSLHSVGIVCSFLYRIPLFTRNSRVARWRSWARCKPKKTNQLP